MTHADPFDLAAHAAGDDLDPATRAHVESCAECRAALQSLRDTAEGRTTEDLPSPGVWRRIHSDLGLAAEVRDDPLHPVAPTPAPVMGAPPDIRDLRTARSRDVRRRGPWIAGLSAAAVVITVLGILIGTRIAAPPPETPPTIVAKAALEPFPGWDDSGRATVEQTASGARYLTIALPGSVPEGDVREVWLMRSDLKALISLGLLEDGTGRFAVPAGIDLDQYDVVDVSSEPVDGNPAHSGKSIVRGVLKIA